MNRRLKYLEATPHIAAVVATLVAFTSIAGPATAQRVVPLSSDEASDVALDVEAAPTAAQAVARTFARAG